MSIPSYCNIINDDYINNIKELLRKATKSYHVNNILYGDLNPSIDYNQILSKMLSNIDNAINCLIESSENHSKESEALKYIEDIFLNNSEVYDYIITSGLFDKFANIVKSKECPISSIKENQKIIIKDNRKVKSSSIPLSSIDEYYTELKLLK